MYFLLLLILLILLASNSKTIRQILGFFLIILLIYIFRAPIMFLLSLLLIGVAFIIIYFVVNVRKETKFRSSNNFYYSFNSEKDFEEFFKNFSQNNSSNYQSNYNSNYNSYNYTSIDEYKKACDFFGIESSDTEQEKKKKFKKFIVKYHPDTYPDKEYATEQTKLAVKYWEIIQKRDNIN